MKKFYILFLLFIASTISSNCQSLTHSEFMGTNSQGNHFWLLFGTDTMFVSPDGINYTPASYYSTSGGIFTIYDFPPSGCGDTAYYNFSISADLIFTDISENCSLRLFLLTLYVWTRINTGIETTDAPVLTFEKAWDVLTVSTGLQGEKDVLVFDMQGKVVHQQKAIGSAFGIQLSDLPKGIYNGRIESGISSQSFRFLR